MLSHDFTFDPTYGCDSAALRAIRPPAEVADFSAFWQATYAETLVVPLAVTYEVVADTHPTHRVRGIAFTTLGGHRVGGWLLEPRSGNPVRGLVIGHGYGGRADPGTGWLPAGAVAILPCAPGFHRSAHADLPDMASRHVIHGIGHRDTYLIRFCVASLWSAASVLLDMHPQIIGRLYFHGGSFGGGLGALAVPWDARFQAACLEVPTFGHHPWRLRCPCVGSGEAVRQYHAAHPEVVDVLAYYDAAVAATHGRVPLVAVPAFFDPAVPPPGQWAVINGWAGPVDLCPITAGHFDNPNAVAEYRPQRAAMQARFV